MADKSLAARLSMKAVARTMTSPLRLHNSGAFGAQGDSFFYWPLMLYFVFSAARDSDFIRMRSASVEDRAPPAPTRGIYYPG